MTQRSDTNPGHPPEGRTEKESRRDLWRIAVTGAILFTVAWLAAGLPQLGSFYFFNTTLVFVALAVFAFVAAVLVRQAAVNAEKKLRLGLLMRNIELESVATRDDLTYLFNRRYLFERLERELETAKKSRRQLSFVTIKLDSLKSVNQSHGYRVGDSVISNFGHFLLEQARASDVPARIGGNEFAVILVDADERAAGLMLERLTKALEKKDLIDEEGLQLHVSASLGASGYPWSADTVDAIVQQAEAAMRAGSLVQATPNSAAS